MTTIICPGCGRQAQVTAERPISRCPHTGGETEAQTRIDCKRCGEKWWGDDEIAMAYEDSEQVWNLEMGA